MVLTNSNIKEWKDKLNEMMSVKTGTSDYSECLKDDEWLDEYIGYTCQDAVDDEIQYWDEPE